MNNDSHKKQQSEKIQTMQEQAFLDKAADALDKSCDSMDGQTLSRLNRIRHARLNMDNNHRAELFFHLLGG